MTMLNDNFLTSPTATPLTAQTDSQIERLKNLEKNESGLAPEQREAKIREAAKEFEGILLQQLLKVMRESMLTKDENEQEAVLGGNGIGGDMYMDLFDGEVARQVALSGGGLGITQMLLDQLSPAHAPDKTDKSPMTLGKNPTGSNLLHGAVTSSFGLRHDPFTGKLLQHNGIDLRAQEGTAVKPAAAGVVTFAGRDGNYGNMVAIQHADGTMTRYAHLNDIFVKDGDYVDERTVIGTVGSTGRSTGPHLHFELTSQDGRMINPKGFLDKLA